MKVCLVKMKTGLNTVTSGSFVFFLIYVSVGLEMRRSSLLGKQGNPRLVMGNE